MERIVLEYHIEIRYIIHVRVDRVAFELPIFVWVSKTMSLATWSMIASLQLYLINVRSGAI